MNEPTDLRLVRTLSTLLDGRYESGRFGFGLDAFIDLLPIGGDTLILLLSLIPIYVAIKRKVPSAVIGRMVTTVVGVYAIGLVPILGSFAYLVVRPNVRNYELLRQHVA